MRWHLLPWKFFLRRAARSYGLIDPAGFAARMRSFAQPAEFDVPLELLRAGVIFHARGLINTRAIQHNLDWIWPFWVEKQFNPRDPSFLPRAFNFSHVNLTHRNWTAVGVPDLSLYPLVDPRGLVTPLFDGWSLDCWVITGDGEALIPSRLKDAQCVQRLHTGQQEVETRMESGALRLRTRVAVSSGDDGPALQLEVNAEADREAWLAVAIRPYNPEGIQFVDTVEVMEAVPGWKVNGTTEVRFSEYPANWYACDYHAGDVFRVLPHGEPRMEQRCRVGMATAAALFPLQERRVRSIEVTVPLAAEAEAMHGRVVARRTWPEVHATVAQLKVPDDRHAALYASAVNTLELLTASEAYPGPYTYRRFWFRDACLMLHGLLAAGLADRVHRHLGYFPRRQRHDGYFASQDGEWDSNGQVLWLFARYAELTGEALPQHWLEAMARAAGWIDRKRLRDPESAHDGLLPAGFSAEHFGPNNFYYWDDYWAVGGLRGAEPLLRRAGMEESADLCRRVSGDLLLALDNSISRLPQVRESGTVPAAPGRRMDSGAIGVLVADYPLRLHEPGDERTVRTADWFMEHSLVKGGFFQDMQHSGINAYLTLMLAQTLLRNGDPRWSGLVRAVAEMASPTGQWPEAIHPHTGGGCIGDGQHGWAAAEWILWTRNAFLREEEGEWIIGSGLLQEWMSAGAELSFGPTLTPCGPATVRIHISRASVRAECVGEWRTAPPRRRFLLPGLPERVLAAEDPEQAVEWSL